MTQDELDALPDVTPGFGQVEREIDGRRVTVPAQRDAVAMFTGPDDGIVMDVEGTVWMTGIVDGVRCKRRTSYWFAPSVTAGRSPPAQS